MEDLTERCISKGIVAMMEDVSHLDDYKVACIKCEGYDDECPFYETPKWKQQY